MDEATMRQHVDRHLESLRCECSEELLVNQVTAIGQVHFDHLLANARILDIIPVLVYRHTRADLVSARLEDLHRAA